MATSSSITAGDDPEQKMEVGDDGTSLQSTVSTTGSTSSQSSARPSASIEAAGRSVFSAPAGRSSHHASCSRGYDASSQYGRQLSTRSSGSEDDWRSRKDSKPTTPSANQESWRKPTFHGGDSVVREDLLNKSPSQYVTSQGFGRGSGAIPKRSAPQAAIDFAWRDHCGSRKDMNAARGFDSPHWRSYDQQWQGKQGKVVVRQGNSQKFSELGSGQIVRSSLCGEQKVHARNANTVENQSRVGSNRASRNHTERHTKTDADRSAEGITLQNLEQLLENSDEEILLALTHPSSGLSSELDLDFSENTYRSHLIIKLVLQALKCEAIPHLNRTLITKVREAKLLSDSHLSNFISRMMLRTQIPHLYEQQILKNALGICHLIVIAYPSACPEILTICLTFKALLAHLAALKVNTSLPSYLSNLQKSCKKLEESLASAQDVLSRESNDQTEDEDYLKLPNKFKHLSLLPKVEDVQTSCKPFFRSNKETGQFLDLEHYLDVQFRLLRADFMMPLQNGIQQYLEQRRGAAPAKQRITDINIYENVHVMGPICGGQRIGYRLKFDASQLHIDWSHSKRLIFGSLVCLSDDNFNALHCATIIGRDARELMRGEVDVFFEDPNTIAHEFDPIQTFTMAESSAFYEAYRHVLHGLQVMKEQGQIPFQKYLVECQTVIEPPGYLTENTNYDFMPIIPTEQGFAQKSRRVQALHTDRWPSAEELLFDPSQRDALCVGLQHEFALIQGPPGTGKTFVGWKITQMLLANKLFKGPILVVCFTNHALDQFLEGIADFQPGGIVRVGSRSQSEKLDCFSLKKLRKDKKLLLHGKLRYNIGKMYRGLKVLEDQIEGITARINVTSSSIVNSRALGIVISSLHMRQLNGIKQGMEKAGSSDVKIMAKWLGYDSLLSSASPHIHLESSIAGKKHGEEIIDNAGAGPEDVEDVPVEVDAAVYHARCLLDIDSDYDDGYYDYDYDYDDDHGRRHETLPEMRRRLRQVANRSMVEVNEDGLSAEPSGEIRGEWLVQSQERRRLKKLLKTNLQDVEMMTKAEAGQVRDIWSLSARDRWRLYHYWAYMYRKKLRQLVPGIIADYQTGCQRLTEIHNWIDERIMRNAAVIGMTTTGAARYHSVLQVIRPRVVIIEEAAEVLEAHILTSLNPDVQHLILIGDHKQLRPSHAEYKLRKHHIDLSLFERMVNNKLECVCLLNQHRMRPEISALMRPIYPGLKDDPSVTKFEHINGIERDIYFIDHNQEETFNSETKSRANDFEAQYAACLCRYLLQQEYKPSRITILTTYSGQLHCLTKWMPKDKFEGVRVCVVDNYQGEENDIIILSLVRSNVEQNIGYLKIENRVCVALSRARMGFYVIRNFRLLAVTRLWQSILDIADKAGFRGPSLMLCCQNHPEVGVVKVQTIKDFEKVPEGGCLKRCDVRLECGHQCPLMCHPYDRDHLEVKCPKPCEKILCERGHQCPKECWQECGDCQVIVEKQKACGHEHLMPCCTDPDKFYCTAEVEKARPACGHKHIMACSFNPDKFYCKVKVEKARSACGHNHIVACSFNLDEFYCKVKVEKARSACGHKHIVACSFNLDKSDCKVEVIRVRPSCDHSAVMNCSQDPRSFPCEEKCEHTLSCGHRCAQLCGERHTLFCKVQMRTLPCGHEGLYECYQKDDTICCEIRCATRLKCGHPCAGTWGQCLGGRRHLACQEHCERVLVCGHQCGGSCRKPCLPCQHPCQRRCPHGNCKKRCGEACIPCTEKCTRQCPHYKCQRRCCDPCDRPRCDQPCMKKLAKCQHPCIGLCGEPCPTKCKVCDKDQLAKILLGTKTLEDARFIQLDICHNIFEVSFLDLWMENPADLEESSVRGKVCPHCSVPIGYLPRYDSLIKCISSEIEKANSAMIGRGDGYDGHCASILDAYDHLLCIPQADLRKMQHKVLTRLKPESSEVVPLHERAALELTIASVAECYKKRSIITEIKLQCGSSGWHMRSKCSSTLPGFKKEWAECEERIDKLYWWIIQHELHFTEQEKHDVEQELATASTVLHRALVSLGKKPDTIFKAIPVSRPMAFQVRKYHRL